MLAGAALLVTAGILNFAQRLRHETPPWDGVRWSDTKQGLLAETVEPGSSGARSQILPGDRLIGISLDNRNYEEIAPRAGMFRFIWIRRALAATFITSSSGPRILKTAACITPTSMASTRFISGRREMFTSISSVWFFCSSVSLCSSSKVGARHSLYTSRLFAWRRLFSASIRPVGTYRDLDLAIAFLRNAAFILFPPLFLHFCLLYPVRQQLFENKRWRAVLLYVPAVLLLLLAIFVFLRGVLIPVVPGLRGVPGFSETFIGFFYKLSFFHFLVGLVASVFFLIRTWIRAKSAVVRQQMKWVIWGSVLAVAPFTLLYAIGFLLGAQTDPGLD